MSKNKGNKNEVAAVKEVETAKVESVETAKVEATQVESVDELAKIASILGVKVETLTPEKVTEARQVLGSFAKKKRGTTDKADVIAKLTETARNHRNALSNNMFELKKLGADETIIAELSAEVPVMEFKTRTAKRLAKEAAGAAVVVAPAANETEGKDAEEVEAPVEA